MLTLPCLLKIQFFVCHSDISSTAYLQVHISASLLQKSSVQFPKVWLAVTLQRDSVATVSVSCIIISGTIQTALGSILCMTQLVLCKTIKSSAAELMQTPVINASIINQSLFI